MSQVGDIVLRHRPELRQVYVPYVTNMMYQEALITKLMSVSTSLTFSWLRSYCCSFSVAFASLNLDVWSVSPFWGPLSCFPHLNTHSTLVYQCWIIPNNQCVFFTLFGLRQQNHRCVLVLHTLEKHPKCQRQTLKSFLVLPFQRITRIKLILQVCRSECICCICLHCTQNGFIIWCLFFPSVCQTTLKMTDPDSLAVGPLTEAICALHEVGQLFSVHHTYILWCLGLIHSLAY